MIRFFTFLALLFSGTIVYAQTAEDYAVELTTTVQSTPPRITLKWKPIITGAPTYQVWKKAKSDPAWGSSIASLTTTDSFYIDNAVIADSAYEYQVWATSTTLSTPMGSSGYLYAGIRNPAIHNKGILLLIVDTTFVDSCMSEIQTMMQDISGDGWQIIRHDIGRSVPDVAIKSIITTDFANQVNVKAVLLLGHVAVPYSGDLNPDGHPNHLGAWPADLYYSCLTGWTDVSINDVSAGYAANQNTPGDGKWDQTGTPSYAQLQVSRIDFYNMPAFTSTEVQLMKSYLTRDHKYKMDSLGIRHRALIDDHFGAFSGEAFAANGWRNFAPLVGRDSVASLPLVSSLAASSYQWAYGCGGGTFTSASGVGVTSDFAANPVNGIFTMTFGSYFGDWNVQNNFLRAPLCSGTPALTNCWAGRPNWFLHHMALGENIGYSALLTQNNAPGSLYQPANYAAQYVHVALMGDLTLRTDYIKPPSNLIITTGVHLGATILWTASSDPAVIGYYIYRADSVFGYFKKISPMLTATSFQDTMGVNGTKIYMVRPVTLQSTPSGAYYNLGIGITNSGVVSYPALGIAEIPVAIGINVFPNPARNMISVTVTADMPGKARLFIINAAGERMNTGTKELKAGDNTFTLNIANMAAGIYNLVVETGNTTVVRKWVKL